MSYIKLNKNQIKKIMTPINPLYDINTYGYHIHRLVALHFIKNKTMFKTKCLQVNHKDGIKTHNFIWNLEWTTPKENIQHSWVHNLSKSIGENNGRNVYSEESIEKVCKLIENNICFNEINEITKVSVPMISLIYRKKNWIHISNKYDFSSYNYGKNKS